MAKDDEILIGQKSPRFIKAIAGYAVVWAIILAASITLYILYYTLFVLLIVAAAVLVLVCAWHAFNYFRTPKECVFKDDGGVKFWSAGKWVYVKKDDIDDARTNLGQLKASYSMLRNQLDRGTVRLFTKHGEMYRIKFLDDPTSVRDRIMGESAEIEY